MLTRVKYPTLASACLTESHTVLLTGQLYSIVIKVRNIPAPSFSPGGAGLELGNCLDNAVTERFFRSLKAERVNYRRYQNRAQSIADVIDYTDSFYNQKRRHYRLGIISPNEYERRLQQCA